MKTLKTSIIFFLLNIQLIGFSQSPITDFDYNITMVNCDYLMVHFSFDTYGNQEYDSCCWYFGDGGRKCREYGLGGSYADHNYSQPGSYTVTLTLWKDSIESNVIKEDIIKIPIAPEPVFSLAYYDSVLFAPIEIQFENNTIIGDCDSVQYFWDFGNSIFSEDENPSIFFDVPQTYYISLNVKDTLDCEKNYADYIIVKDTAQRGEFDFITGGCYNDYEIPPCGYEKHFEIRNDSLLIYGFYYGNCGTTKTATIRYSGDTVIVRTWEVGPLTTCSCGYCFEIGIPNITQDSTIVKFNDQIYIARITGIQERINIEKSINIYPNPTFNYFIVDYYDSHFNNLSYEILDVNGALRQSGVLNQQNKIQIDRQKITKGFYIVVLKNENEVKYTKKIILD